MLSEHQEKERSHRPEPEADADRPTVYQIRVKSHLDSDWADWFDGLTITREENGESLLTGLVIDQAALHGLLRKVRDLGMTLVSVNCLKTDPAHLSNTQEEESQ